MAAVTSALGLHHARRSRTEAEQALERAEAVNDFLRSMLASAAPDQLGAEVKVTEVLEQAPDREGEFFRVPRILGES